MFSFTCRMLRRKRTSRVAVLCHTDPVLTRSKRATWHPALRSLMQIWFKYNSTDRQTGVKNTHHTGSGMNIRSSSTLCTATRDRATRKVRNTFFNRPILKVSVSYKSQTLALPYAFVHFGHTHIKSLFHSVNCTNRHDTCVCGEHQWLAYDSVN